MQKQVASVNTTVTGKLLADLGIAYNFSDSGIDSSENDARIEADMGDVLGDLMGGEGGPGGAGGAYSHDSGLHDY